MSEHSLRGRARLSDSDAQIESLRDRRKQVLLRANERFARATIKAGLAELTIPDDALDAAFEEVAARFRKISVTATAKTRANDTANRSTRKPATLRVNLVLRTLSTRTHLHLNAMAQSEAMTDVLPKCDIARFSLAYIQQGDISDASFSATVEPLGNSRLVQRPI